MIKSETGIVYLVGAGPGDPGLITVKGAKLLETCDAIVYDNLIPDELISALPDYIEKHYVGKRAGKACASQDEINVLLIKLANENKIVVRLKGSDPLIFGRGGEEAKYLKENNIAFEIVPGVTAAVAASAYSGIPLTDREKASFVTFATGHKAKDKAVSSVPWNQLAKCNSGTLVIYMGVGQIKNISKELTDSGMPSDTPTAVIERGTLPSSRTVISTVGNISSDVEKNNIKAPALFVIGETVRLNQTLKWIKAKPLSGKRVLVTRPGDQAVEMYEYLRSFGAEVLPYPTIKTSEVKDDATWDKIRKLKNENKWLLFSSENGVRYFLKQYFEYFDDIRTLADYKIARMGNGTLRALKNNQLCDDYAPISSSSIALAEGLSKQSDIEFSTIIRVRGNMNVDIISKMLESKGMEIIPLEVYKTENNYWAPEVKEKIREFPPDYIIFTSSLAVDGFMANVNKEDLAMFTSNAQIISIGKMTSKSIESYNLKVAYEAGTPSIESVVEELAEIAN